MHGKWPWRLLSAAALVAFAGFLGLLLTALKAGTGIIFWMTVLAYVLGMVWLGLEVAALRQNVMRYFARMNTAISNTLLHAPERMPIPVTVLNSRHEIVWYNRAFAMEVAGRADLFGEQLATLIPLRPDVFEDGQSIEMDTADRCYRVSRMDYGRKNGRCIMLTFQDITNYAVLRSTYMNTRSCVLLIVIDNFEDLFKGTRQSERASALAALDMLFDRMLDGTHSIFCHLDEDRFMIVTEARHCLEMERAQFPLLDETRKIMVRGSNSLTLSIGVGRSGENLAQNEAQAQQSLDMALGRGGDQAAVRTENGYTFYGGISTGIEHRNKAKNRAFAKEMERLMLRSSHVYIMGHRNSDLDAVGAAVGVAFIAQMNDIPCNIVIRTESTLAGLLTDRIRKELPGCMLSPEIARERITDTDLLVIVDTFSKDIVEDAELYGMAQHVVVIDHHRQMVNYIENTSLKLHDPHASSAAELVTGLIQHYAWSEQLPQFHAEALLAGIMLDTKNFIMQTGVHTFEAAGFLRERGADPIAVKTLFAESLDAYRYRSKIVSEAVLHGRYAVACETEVLPEIRIIASQAADELLGVEGVAASFVVFDNGTQASISARSLGRVNVQVIMERLGGGGHHIMAATQRSDLSVAQLRSLLIQTLDEMDAESMHEP